MKNTYAKISHITSQQVTDRLMSANSRVASAASEMVGIYHRRETAVIQVPADCPMVELPALSDLPVAIRAATSPERLNAWHSRYDSAKTAIHRDTVWNSNASGYHLVLSTATPAQIVAAIHAADAYATDVEAIAGKYRADVAQAIVEHVGSQVDSVNELAGLVAQIA
jgi:hypothetical protein